MHHIRMFLPLLLICLIFSCKDQDQAGDEHTKVIDSLLTELRMMDDSMKTLNIMSIQKMNDSLRQYYDTADVRDTLKKRYQAYVRSREILNRYDNVTREINFSRSHLNALKEKYKREDIPDSLKQKELEKEKAIIASIRERFGSEFQSLRGQVNQLLTTTDIDE